MTSTPFDDGVLIWVQAQVYLQPQFVIVRAI